MKDRASCVMRRVSRQVVRAVFAAGLVVLDLGVASAADITWTGAAGNGKWSDGGNWKGGVKPGSGDAAYFDNTAVNPDSVVDEEFGGTVQRVFLKAGYTGTLTLQRSLRVAYQWEQRAGTVTCGANDLWVGTSGTSGTDNGKFELYGGTFNAPSTVLRVTTKNNGVGLFRIDEAVTWNANGGTVYFDPNSTYMNYMYFSNRTFCNMCFGGLTTGGMTLSDCSNNRVTGTLSHIGGVILGGNSTSLFIEGAVNVSSNANGGTAWLTFTSDADQTITFGDYRTEGALEYGRTCGIKVAKPDGRKVKVLGGSARFGRTMATYGATDKGWSGFNVSSGTLDFSELDKVSAVSANSTISKTGSGEILMPGDFEILNSTAAGSGKDWGTILDATGLEFNNLTLHLRRCLFVNNLTTNIVKGSLTIDGAGLYHNQPKDTNSTKWWTTGNAQNGMFLVYGNVTNLNTCADAINLCGRNGVVMMVGAGDSVIYSDGGFMPTLIVAKDEGAKVFCEPSDHKLMTRTQSVSHGFVLQSGEFTMPEAGYANSNSYFSAFYQLGGTLNCGHGDFYFGGYTQYIKVIDPIGGVTVSLPGTTGGLMIDGKSTLTVSGKFVCSKGRIGYRQVADTSKIVLQGDYCISNCWYGGNMPIYLTGDKDQRYYCAEYGSNNCVAVTVNKTGGRLILDSDMDFHKRINGGASVKLTDSQAINLTAGTLDLNGHTLTLPPTGTTTVGEGFRFAFPAAEPEARACVVAADKLQFPTTAGSVELELTGKLTPEAPSPISVFGYGSLVKAFDPAVFALVPNPLLSKRFKVTNDGTEKLISLAYAYKRGTLLYVR